MPRRWLTRRGAIDGAKYVIQCTSRRHRYGIQPRLADRRRYGYSVEVRLTVRIVVSGFGLAWAMDAQGLLPPDVLLLARVKSHMQQELARLPNCSCLETVRRDRKPAGGVMRPLDTVRVEVLYSDRPRTLCLARRPQL